MPEVIRLEETACREVLESGTVVDVVDARRRLRLPGKGGIRRGDLDAAT